MDRRPPVLRKKLLPEIKILSYIFFVIVVAVSGSFQVYGIIFSILLLFLLLIPFSTVKSGWIPVSLFLIFTFFSNVLNQHGKILFSTGFLVITEEGLNIAVIRTLRVLFMIWGAKILIATSKTEEIIHGLRTLLLPFEKIGLPISDFFSMMGLTLKCFPILKDMLYENYRKSITSANITGLWNKAKAVSMFLLPMFVESIQFPDKFFNEENAGEKTN